MSTPAEVVETQFSNATAYANAGVTNMEAAIDAFLAAAAFTNPTVDVEFSPVAAPTILAAATRPGALDILEDEFAWDPDSVVADNKPTPLSIDAPEITIDDFDEAAPTIDTSDQPTLVFPESPTITLDTVPEVATADEVTTPDDPTIEDVTAPTLLTLTTPTFAGVDLDETFLATLKEIPTLTLVAPTPYTHSVGAEYTSTLLTTVKALLNTRAAGGTGLDPTVEAAIFGRGQDRETLTLQANIDEVERTSEALGWTLPADVLAGGVRKAQENYYAKLGDLSRDVTIKQADLEQANLKDTISYGIQLEGQLVTYSYQLERLAFENSSKVADNAISVHNAQLEKFKTTLEAYNIAKGVYAEIIRGQQMYVDVFRAEIAAEQAKADANKTLIEQYKAQIDAGLSIVRIFEAKMNAAKTRMELEQIKVQASAERIKGFVAKINGETAKIELYKAGVAAEGTKAQAWDTLMHGRLAEMEGYKAKANAFQAKAGAQEAKAKAELSRFVALIQAKTAEYDGWRTIIEGEKARLQAIGQKAESVLAGYKVDAAIIESQSAQDIKRWETQIREYEAGKQYTLNGQKMNADLFLATKELNASTMKAAAQIWSQYTSSALAMIHTSAGVSASASNSVGYSYSNDTATAPASVTAV